MSYRVLRTASGWLDCGSSLLAAVAGCWWCSQMILARGYPCCLEVASRLAIRRVAGQCSCVLGLAVCVLVLVLLGRAVDWTSAERAERQQGARIAARCSQRRPQQRTVEATAVAGAHNGRGTGRAGGASTWSVTHCARCYRPHQTQCPSGTRSVPSDFKPGLSR